MQLKILFLRHFEHIFSISPLSIFGRTSGWKANVRQVSKSTRVLNGLCGVYNYEGLPGICPKRITKYTLKSTSMVWASRRLRFVATDLLRPLPEALCYIQIVVVMTDPYSKLTKAARPLRGRCRILHLSLLTTRLCCIVHHRMCWQITGCSLSVISWKRSAPSWIRSLTTSVDHQKKWARRAI